MEPDEPYIEGIEIIELLGKGGMSLVYKARQMQLDRIVALKVLSKTAVCGEEGIKRFQKEARLTSKLEHPNIVKTISFGVLKEEQPYLIMEYLEGLSLAEDLKQNGRLKLQKFKDIFLPALSALKQAQQAGMVHRDIKPANIMICRTDTGAETVKLLDFGIAKVYGQGENQTQQVTNTGVLKGSPAYMSPEQSQGKPLDGRSDLYSIACVMYEALCGEPPFTGDSILEVMQKHSLEPPPTVSDFSRKIDIPKELAEVILWGLAKDPAARPQTASEFARMLNEVLEGITLDKVPRLNNPKTIALETLAQHRPIIALVSLCTLMLGMLVFMLRYYQPEKHVQETAGVRNSLANFYRQWGKNAEAESLLKSVQVHDDSQAASLEKENNVERMYRSSLARADKVYASDDPKLISHLQDLATFYLMKERWLEAVPILERLLAIREKVLGPDDLDVADSLADLGLCYVNLGSCVKAEPLLRRAMTIRENALAANDPLKTVCLTRLGKCYLRQGKLQEAEAPLKRALAINETAFEASSPQVYYGLIDLAECYRLQGRLAEAETLLKRAGGIQPRASR